MNKQVFIINGSGGCGKDTFVEIVKSQAKRISVRNYSSVTKVKEIAKIIGWDGTKSERDRLKQIDIIISSNIIII